MSVLFSLKHGGAPAGKDSGDEAEGGAPAGKDSGNKAEGEAADLEGVARGESDLQRRE